AGAAPLPLSKKTCLTGRAAAKYFANRSTTRVGQALRQEAATSGNARGTPARGREAWQRSRGAQVPGRTALREPAPGCLPSANVGRDPLADGRSARFAAKPMGQFSPWVAGAQFWSGSRVEGRSFRNGAVSCLNAEGQ